MVRIANRAGAALLVSALFILIFVAAIFRRNAADFTGKQEAAEHIHQVIDAAHATLSALIDTETGQRGYLLTGKESYLAPYESGRRNYQSSIALLRKLAAGEPALSARVDEIADESEKKLAELAATIALAHANSRADAIERVRQDVGKHYMDQLRDSVSRGVRDEESAYVENARLIARSQSSFRNQALLAAALLFLLTLTGTVLLSVEIRFERRTAAHLELSQKKYRELAQSLEDQVAERTKELRQVNKELNAFAYSVSHDLRAPLRAIDGFSQMVIEDYYERLDASGRDMLNRIRNGAKRMGQLIQSLLELTRVTREDLSVERVSLTNIAESSVEALAAAAPDRRVEVHIAPDLTVDADVHLMRIVLDNLLANAWKFTSRTGEARIDVGRMTFGGRTVFFVRDNGAGFDPAYASKLFTPFQRLHADSEFEGTGIGLATVQRVIHRHGGRIWAESKPRHGATFFFEL